MRLSKSERKMITDGLLDHQALGKIPGTYDTSFVLSVDEKKEPYHFDYVMGLTENLDELVESREVTIRLGIKDLVMDQIVCDVAYMKLRLVNVDTLYGTLKDGICEYKNIENAVLPLLSTSEFEKIENDKLRRIRTYPGLYIAKLENLYVSPTLRRLGVADVLIKNLNELLYREFRGFVALLGVEVNPLKDQLELEQYLLGIEHEKDLVEVWEGMKTYDEIMDFLKYEEFKSTDKENYFYRSYM